MERGATSQELAVLREYKKQEEKQLKMGKLMLLSSCFFDVMILGVVAFLYHQGKLPWFVFPAVVVGLLMGAVGGWFVMVKGRAEAVASLDEDARSGMVHERQGTARISGFVSRSSGLGGAAVVYRYLTLGGERLLVPKEVWAGHDSGEKVRVAVFPRAGLVASVAETEGSS